MKYRCPTRKYYSSAGCINLIGAVINQAIKDYNSDSLREKLPFIWQDSKDFLFKDRLLEEYLENYGIEDKINVGFIRKNVLDPQRRGYGFLGANDVRNEEVEGDNTLSY